MLISESFMHEKVLIIYDCVYVVNVYTTVHMCIIVIALSEPNMYSCVHILISLNVKYT